MLTRAIGGSHVRHTGILHHSCRTRSRHHVWSTREGNAGLRDKVDRHYKRLFGSAALSSLFSVAFDVSQRQNQSVLNYPSPSQTAEASVSRNMSETGSAITRRNLNVQPTIKVPVGYRFTVRVNRDILFDAPYEPIQADPQTAPQGMQLRQRSSLLWK